MASQPILALAPPSTPLGTAVSLEPEMLIPLAAGVAYAAPGAFLAWLQRARPGQVCIYARATMLSHREPIGSTVRLVADAAQVSLYQSRPHALFPYLYHARRTGKSLALPLRPGSGQACSPARLRAALSDQQLRLLDHLTELAETGRPHGSNSGLAMRLGLGSRASVGSALAVLERHGLIRRSSTPLGTGGEGVTFSRVIEIVETGQKTRGCR